MSRQYSNIVASWATGATGENESDMLYRETISSPHGGNFQLMREENHTEEDIKRAKQYIRRNHDVVSISVVTEQSINRQ